jgi:hypothetical protein
MLFTIFQLLDFFLLSQVMKENEDEENKNEDKKTI